MKTVCGLDCETCWARATCAGCQETYGKPYGGTCMIALCCEGKGGGRLGHACEACENRGHSFDAPCRLKEELCAEFNALGIPDMPPVTKLNALWGDFINLTFTLPGGQRIKIWDGRRVYLGNRLQKLGTDHFYGLTADEHYLLVCEFDAEGAEPEIVVYKRRENPPSRS